MHILNIILFWIFFGCLSSYIAKRRGRHPLLWFTLGMLLGVLSLVLIFLLPKPGERRKKALPPQQRVEVEEKPAQEMWYYLDSAHMQKGPVSKEELLKALEEGEVTHDSFVWKAGMKEWAKLHTLPELTEHLQLATN